MSKTTEILVTGGGLVGLTAATALAVAGWQVTICAPKTASEDTRTTAFLWNTVEYFQKLELWDDLAELAFPLKTMRIVDGTNRLLRAPQTDFHATEIDLEAFGYNLKNSDVLNLLKKKIQDAENIVWIDGAVKQISENENTYTAEIESASDQTTIEAKFVAAADGRNSLVRDTLLPGVSRWSYPQTALVVDFTHEHSTNFVSTEFHTESGPFTIVPRDHYKAGLVWLETPERISELVKCSKSDMETILERKMQSFLGKVSLTNSPVSFPMSGLIANRFGDGNVALLGEAAHVFPPIGAQGFNLGTRDIATLVEILTRFKSTENRGQIYSNKRRTDIQTRTIGVDLLNRSLLSEFLPNQIVRTFGLLALNRFAPLRKTAMKLGISSVNGLKG